MADCKRQLVSDVTESLVGQLESADIEVVSDEMLIALRDYEVTRRSTDLVRYEGFNEMLLKRYTACLIISGKSPKTIDAYERIVRKLFLALQKNFTDMTVSDLRYFLAIEKSRGVSNRTLENTRVMLSAFFTWMLEEDVIEKNPCRPIKPIRYNKKVRKPFSTLDIDAMRAACQRVKWRAILEMLLSSGVRVSELCDLKVSDVDFERLTVTVRNGKGAKQRVTYINEITRKYLLDYLATRTTQGEYLFYNNRKQPLKPGGVRSLLKKVEEDANVSNVHPHRFRRTLATSLAFRGMEIQEIAKLLGHTNINTTLEYIYTSDAQVQSSYKKYAA